MRISRASSEQRAGRAGRLAPGACYRLWSETTQRGLVPQSPPEIRAADLASLALELAAWGAREARALAWLDPPPEAAFSQARELLTELDALDSSGLITKTGRDMARLPLHPRLSHMLFAAERLGLEALACDVAALLSERDILAVSRVDRPISRNDSKPCGRSACMDVRARSRIMPMPERVRASIRPRSSSGECSRCPSR